MKYPKSNIVKDKPYLRWVQKKPCLVCGERYQETVAPHHLMGRKRDDKVVPLCVYHHAANASNYSIHNINRERFEEMFDKDLDFEADKLYKEWGSL